MLHVQPFSCCMQVLSSGMTKDEVSLGFSMCAVAPCTGTLSYEQWSSRNEQHLVFCQKILAAVSFHCPQVVRHMGGRFNEAAIASALQWLTAEGHLFTRGDYFCSATN